MSNWARASPSQRSNFVSPEDFEAPISSALELGEAVTTEEAQKATFEYVKHQRHSR